MSKTVWIIGAVIVVGIGVAAGLIFAGGGGDSASSNAPAKGSGVESVATAPAVETPQMAQDVEPVAEQDVEPVAVTEPVDVPEQPVGEAMNEVMDGEQFYTVANIDTLMANASMYANQEVVVTGTIVTQCIRGCQFSLEDGTGVVAVELVDEALEKILERGSVGKKVEVRGILERSPRLLIVVEEPENWRYLD